MEFTHTLRGGQAIVGQVAAVVVVLAVEVVVKLIVEVGVGTVVALFSGVVLLKPGTVALAVVVSLVVVG